MKPEFLQYELIDNFLAGKLTGSELQNFQNRMAIDASFKTDVESQQIANAFIMDSGLVELRQKMDGFRPAEKSVPRSLQLYIVAAGVIFLAGFMFWYTSNDKITLSEKELATEVIIPSSVDEEKAELVLIEEITAFETVVTNEDVKSIADNSEISQDGVEETNTPASFSFYDVQRHNEINDESEDVIDTEVAGIDSNLEMNPDDSNENKLDAVPVKNCRPTSLFPKVEFDEFYSYVDVEIAEFGTLEEPYKYYVNDKEVQNFKNLEPVSAELKIIDVNGCEGSAIVEIHLIEE